MRPIVNLLSLECSLLQNFEALMALTNLAGLSERLRLATRGNSSLRIQVENMTELCRWCFYMCTPTFPLCSVIPARLRLLECSFSL